MKIETRTVYDVIHNTCPDDGRGRNYIASTWLYAADAEKVAKGSGGFGSDAPVESRNVKVVITDEGEVYLLGERVSTRVKTEEEILREQALAKLSEAEKKILGLV